MRHSAAEAIESARKVSGQVVADLCALALLGSRTEERDLSFECCSCP